MAWVTANNIIEETIKLQRYQEGGWQPLPTDIVGKDENFIYCSAKTAGFSIFAVTGEAREKPTPLPWDLIAGIAAAVLILIAVTLRKKRKI